MQCPLVGQEIAFRVAFGEAAAPVGRATSAPCPQAPAVSVASIAWVCPPESTKVPAATQLPGVVHATDVSVPLVPPVGSVGAVTGVNAPADPVIANGCPL